MKNIIAILLSIFVTSLIAFGQTQEATTTEGKKIILNSDGTWKYEEVKKDTAKNNPSDCSNWIATETDKVSGNTYTASKNTLVVSTDGGDTGLGIFMMLGSKSLILIVQAAGKGSCIDKGDKINILFTDNSRMELASEGDFNCENNATVYFGGIFGKKTS